MMKPEYVIPQPQSDGLKKASIISESKYNNHDNTNSQISMTVL